MVSTHLIITPHAFNQAALNCVTLCFVSELPGWRMEGGGWRESSRFLVRKLVKKGKAVPLNWKITTVQYRKKSGDRVHSTWHNPLHRLT